MVMVSGIKIKISMFFQVKSHVAKEFHQVNEEKPQMKEESSLIVKQDGQITQECVKSNSILPLTPKLTRKSTAPRFISPLQGKIVDQGSDVEIEGIVDGKILTRIIFFCRSITVLKLKINFQAILNPVLRGAKTVTI